MPSVTVCTPWIDVDCYWRQRSKQWTRAYWWNLGVDVVYGISDARPVNRSQARNDAARKADSDVLFFCDADMWVDEKQFRAAVHAAWTSGRMVLAYVDHLRLSKGATQGILDGAKNTRYEGQTIKGCSSGAFAVTRELYEEVGGHDERFTGWGYEDRCFMFACDTIAGPGWRIPGTSLHLYHPRGIDQSSTTPERKRGRALAIRYKNASGVKGRSGVLPVTRDAVSDPAAMRELLSEDGGPLHRRLDSTRVR